MFSSIVIFLSSFFSSILEGAGSSLGTSSFFSSLRVSLAPSFDFSFGCSTGFSCSAGFSVVFTAGAVFCECDELGAGFEAELFLPFELLLDWGLVTFGFESTFDSSFASEVFVSFLGESSSFLGSLTLFWFSTFFSLHGREF